MSDITRQKTIDYLYYLKTHYPKNLIIPEYIDFAISSLETDETYQLEYEPTTKNDLGVDAISRQAVLDLINADWKYENLEIEINNLPSVTPQESRKGHWFLTDVEGNKVWHCHCSECGKDPQDYVGGSENWWLIKSKLPKFCPSCGSDNREVEE